MLKKVVITLVVVFGIVFIASKGLEWWLEHSFEKTLNSNPDRGYNITYTDFDLHTFFKGVSLDGVRIEPLKDSGTVVNGTVRHANIDGLIWTQLLLSKRLNLHEIKFEEPEFEIKLSPDTVHKANTHSSMQSLFGDILSRADVHIFTIERGSMMVLDPSTGTQRGMVSNINIKASQLETDSMHMQYIIPFQMGNLEIAIDSANFALNDYTKLHVGEINFNLADHLFRLQNIALGYDIGWVEVSNRMGVQKDVVELTLDELTVHELASTNEFYSQLDVVASKIKISGLDIKFQRNKKLNRPPDEVKPMFQGLINAIPTKVFLDTIQVENSKIAYGELGKNKDQTGEITFTDVNGHFIGITNFEEEQDSLGEATAQIEAKLLGKADVNVSLTIPYATQTFFMTVDLGRISTRALNPSLVPLAGVRFTSGTIHKIHFEINANDWQAQNQMIFDYKDLKLDVVGRDESGQLKKKGLLSSIANTAIRPNNMPGDKSYLRANYSIKRNRYRAPIQYFVYGMMQGAMHIVPGKTARTFLLKDGKKKK